MPSAVKEELLLKLKEAPKSSSEYSVVEVVAGWVMVVELVSEIAPSAWMM